MCLYPKLIKNPKYKSNKKNGGIVPEMTDRRVALVPIGCKKCIECKKQKARDWRVRLLEDQRTRQDAIFVTLTFSDQSIIYLKRKVEKEFGKLVGYDLDNAIAAKAVRLFTDNWRKKNKKALRHWLVTELGHEGTENIHLHGIIWSKNQDAIKAAWKRGWIYFGYSYNEKGINYFTKYIHKVDADHKYYNPKIFCSAGIGAGYEDRPDSKRNAFKEFEDTNELYVNRQGFKMALPIYFRNKLYNEDEREKLWIRKLDKGVRFVLGSEVDVRTPEGLKVYYSLLNEARSTNRKLGYGDDEVNWNEVSYENRRRELMIKKRVNEKLEAGIDYDPDTGECL